jgi:hypothetical protein
MAEPLIITLTQGETYGLFPEATIAISGNFSDWLPKGQIRSDYGGELLATWQFLPLQYDAQNDRTTLSFWLGAEKTSAIPMPDQWKKSEIKIGFSVYVTDIELHHPTDTNLVKKVLRQIPVKMVPEVTIDG